MSTSTLKQIKTLITQALSPTFLEVVDDSRLHIGHAGAQEGKGHYTVIIKSDVFDKLPKIAQHQLVYKSLGNLMQTHIHALSIKIKSE